MSKIRGQILGVLTTLVVASFVTSHAQNARLSAPFRDNAAWTVADGVWSTTLTPASPEEYLMTRGGALADSVTSFEYRAPAGSSAKLYLMGRYAVELSASARSEEHTSELQSRLHLVCRLLLEKKKKKNNHHLQQRH